MVSLRRSGWILLEALLFGQLKVEGDALVFVGTPLGEGEGFGEVVVLADGEFVEPVGEFLQGLVALVFEENLAQLDEDVFLRGVGVEEFGLAEQVNHALHLFVAEPIEDGLDGAQHFDVGAGEVVALEFGQQGADLRIDDLSALLELLLEPGRIGVSNGWVCQTAKTANEAGSQKN